MTSFVQHVRPKNSKGRDSGTGHTEETPGRWNNLIRGSLGFGLAESVIIAGGIPCRRIALNLPEERAHNIRVIKDSIRRAAGISAEFQALEWRNQRMQNSELMAGLLVSAAVM